MSDLLAHWLAYVIVTVAMFVGTVVFGKIPPAAAILYVGPAAAIVAVLDLLGVLERLPW